VGPCTSSSRECHSLDNSRNGLGETDLLKYGSKTGESKFLRRHVCRWLLSQFVTLMDYPRSSFCRVEKGGTCVGVGYFSIVLCPDKSSSFSNQGLGEY
jgi:hypothetical protein